MCWTCIALGPMVRHVEGRPDKAYHSCCHCFPPPVLGFRSLPVDKQARHYLKDIIKDLPFLEAIDVDGDGNCLAHALSRCISGCEILFSALRSDLAEELFAHIDFYEEALKGKYPEDSLHEELCSAADEATDDGTTDPFGHGKELSPLHVFGFANLLRRPIILYSARDDFVSSNAAVYLPVRTGEARLPDGNPIGPLLIAWSSQAKHHFVSLIPAPETDQEDFRIPLEALPRNPENGDILVFAYDQAECESYMQDGAFVVRAQRPREEYDLSSQLPVWKNLWKKNNPDQTYEFAKMVGQRKYSERKDMIRQARILSMATESDSDTEESMEQDGVVLMLPRKDTTNSDQPDVQRVLQVSNILGMLANSLSESDARSLLKGFSDAAEAHNSMEFEPDSMLMEDLTSMGCDESFARKACLATRNQGIEEALDWMERNPSEPQEHQASLESSTLDVVSNPLAQVKWRSEDPRTGLWVQYDAAVAASLEEQFQSGRRMGKIFLGSREFTVDFTPGAMEQINSMGYGRAVERIAPAKNDALVALEEQDQQLEGSTQPETSVDKDPTLRTNMVQDSLSGERAPRREAWTQAEKFSEEVSHMTKVDPEILHQLQEDSMPEVNRKLFENDTHSNERSVKVDSLSISLIDLFDASHSEAVSSQRQYLDQIEVLSEDAARTGLIHAEDHPVLEIERQDMSELVSHLSLASPEALVRSVSLQPKALPPPLEPPKLVRLSSAPARMELRWFDPAAAKKLVHIECN